MTAIRPDTRIADLLKAHPELLDTLADYAPAFARLRNPLLRRTVGRMATLAQAATMGDADLADLLRTLREVAGEPVMTREEPVATASHIPLSAATPEPPSWLDTGRIETHFDARPFHAKGQNPIEPILKAAGSVPEGKILHLQNTFEPLPLYELLGKQGFMPWASKNGTEAWDVFFYRAGPGEQITWPDAVTEEPPAGTESLTGAPLVASVRIDVSQLTPPEPMKRVLEALAHLKPGETLLVRHVQRPMYLYDKLDKLGHAHQTWEIAPGQVEILIRVGERK